jgi:activator of HSP90 ATPase
LVEPRQDGTNVNGWHWQDKNRFAWAKERLEQALPELPPAEAGNVRISKVTDVVGEVGKIPAVVSAATTQQA